MFLGHYAVALAAKKTAPRASLGTLMLAAQFVDLLWPVLLVAGVEHVRIDPGNTSFTPLDFYDYPISHSLVGAMAWAVLFGALYYCLRRYGRGAQVVTLCVFSHWVLDYLTHRPDLPLWPGGPRLGLGLWNSIPGTLLVESALFVAGVALYAGATRGKDRAGTYGFWSLVGVLAVIYALNARGAPPPDTQVLALVGNGAWLFVIWAYWVDRRRVTRGGATEAKTWDGAGH